MSISDPVIIETEVESHWVRTMLNINSPFESVHTILWVNHHTFKYKIWVMALCMCTHVLSTFPMNNWWWGCCKKIKVYTKSETKVYWFIKFLEMVQQLSEKHSFPLKTSFNNSRGFYIQLYTGPGANDRLDCINVLHLHTCTCLYNITCTCTCNITQVVFALVSHSQTQPFATWQEGSGQLTVLYSICQQRQVSGKLGNRIHSSSNYIDTAGKVYSYCRYEYY